MRRVIGAELLRLVQRRTVVAAVLGAVAFAALTTLTVFPSAEENAVPSRRGGTTLDQLTGPGGGTEAFAVGASFAGFLVFVTFIALVASEFSGGTFRSLLLRYPHRLRLVVGKLAAALLVAAGVIALFQVATFALALVVAPAQDVARDEWLSMAGLGEAAGDYLSVFAGVTGWAIFGATLGVAFRSAPLALGVGFAWAGPFENIVVDSWERGFEVFPGQVLGSVMRGGTVEVGMAQGLATAAAYAGLAAAVSAVLVAWRDVAA